MFRFDFMNSCFFLEFAVPGWNQKRLPVIKSNSQWSKVNVNAKRNTLIKSDSQLTRTECERKKEHIGTIHDSRGHGGGRGVRSTLSTSFVFRPRPHYKMSEGGCYHTKLSSYEAARRLTQGGGGGGGGYVLRKVSARSCELGDFAVNLQIKRINIYKDNGKIGQE